MRKKIILFGLVVIGTVLQAREWITIVLKNQSISSFDIQQVDSVSFSTDRTRLRILHNGNTTREYVLSEIQEVYFNESPDTVWVRYTGASAELVNPLSGGGVEAEVSGSGVVIRSTLTDREVVYQLSGSSTSGFFKLYSDYRAEIMLNGLQLAGQDGPAINVQSKKKITVTLAGISTLADAAVYAVSTEDQKATFFSEGQLVFRGDGKLNVSSVTKHGICSDDYLKVESGTISITSVAKNGLHCNDDITIEGGEVNVNLSAAGSKGLKSDLAVRISGGKLSVTSTGGVSLEASGTGYDPSYCTGIKSGTAVVLTGGEVTLNQTGAGSKGISAGIDLWISGGQLVSSSSGTAAKYTNPTGVADAYSSTSLTADGNINITGGIVTTTSTGIAGKGISANGTLTIGGAGNNPEVTVSTSGAKLLVSGSNYTSAKALKSDGILQVNDGILKINSSDDGMKSEVSVVITGGEVNIPASVEGIESKIIDISGGSVNVVASNDGLNTTMGTTSGGTEQNDGSYLYIKGGTVVVSGTKGDAIDSNGNAVFSGGVTIVHGPPSSPEEDIDINGNMTVNGGLVIGSTTNSNMNKAFATSSGQYAVYTKSSAAITAGSLFRIQDATGKELVTFRPLRAAYGVHFSSAELKTGTSYSIYHGGAYSGGTDTNGLLQGGSYSGGTLKKSFTITAKSTTITY